LKGLKSKLGYLRRLGVTAIWISPVFKQVPFEATYHGYGIQNFLDVDPHFGTREDLRDLVDAAHQQGIYCILDIILNHAANVFGYRDVRYQMSIAENHWIPDPRWDGHAYERGPPLRGGCMSLKLLSRARHLWCGPTKIRGTTWLGS
jgi:glycosidase